MTVTTITKSVTHGILLGSGGYGATLTITNTGTVHGASYAINAPFGGGSGVYGATVVNAGHLSAPDIGVILQWSGALSNSGSIYGGTIGVAAEGGAAVSNTGHITSAEYGVYLNGATLTNAGSVSGTVAGVILEQSTFINSASGQVWGGRFGVGAGGYASVLTSVINQGVIGSTTIAVDLNGGDLTNSWLISGGDVGGWLVDVTGSNSGVMYGGLAGVYAQGGTFTNTGTLSSPAGFGLGLVGASASNSGTITGSAAAVYAHAYASFSNSGFVEGTTTGVYITNASASNTGVISSAHTAVALYGGTFSDSFLLSGGTYALKASGTVAVDLTTSAVIQGRMVDVSGNGLLNLQGSGAGTLTGLGESITGFTTLDLSTGAAWTLEGSAAGLAAGQAINGFGTGDALVLDNFAATSDAMTRQGLVLSNGGGTETLAISGVPFLQEFSLSTNGTSTTLAFAPLSAAVSIISSTVWAPLTLGAESVASNLTVTGSGYVEGISAAAQQTLTNQGSIGTVHMLGADSLLNTGIIAGAYGVFDGGEYSGAVIDNSGTIAADTTTGIGVKLGNVFQTLDNTGLISAPGTAVWAWDGTLANAGRILGAVYMSNGTLLNSGYIMSTGSLAVSTSEFPTVNNTGTILAPNGVALEIGATPFGSLGNTGVIMGGSIGVLDNGATLVDSGYISGGSYAVLDSNGVNGGSLTLTLTAGARFAGAVKDDTGAGTLVLAGSVGGSLDIGASFSGFSGVTFQAGSAWTLEGTARDLASGQRIAGFLAGDTLVLDSFAATAETFVQGDGLVLSDGGATETLTMGGGFTTSDFSIAVQGGATRIIAQAGTVTPLSLVTTPLTGHFLLGSAYYAANFTVTNTGAVLSASGYALDSSVYSQGTVTINNAGTIDGIALESLGSVANSGLIAGVMVNNGVIDNTGQITDSADLASGTLLNTGDITGNTAVYLFTASLVNSGTIVGTGIGVFDREGTIVNTGVIQGGNEALYIDWPATLTNAGTIIGNISAALALALTIDPGAVFEGNVIGQGDIVLAGSSASSLDMGASFSGFSQISFAAGSAWTLEGASIALAAGQAISGFGLGDTLVLDGFAATSETFVTGTGLVLGSASGIETIGLKGSFGTSNFAVSAADGKTTIAALTWGPTLLSTISTTLDTHVTLGSAYIAAALTVTSTGTVLPGVGYVVTAGGGTTLVNAGTIGGVTGLGTVSNTGAITGTSYGIAVETSSLTNAGVITGLEGVNNAGVSMTNSGDITGTSLGVIADGAGFSQAALLNTGSIYGGGIGLNFTNFGTVTNAGSIGGGTVGVSLAVFDTLVNSGTVFGGTYAVTSASVITIIDEPGGSFVGKVASGEAEAGTFPAYTLEGGTIDLVGTTAGTLEMANSFSGFTSISFAAGGDWTVEGWSTALASGQTISGFAPGDTLGLEGFYAWSDTYVPGEGVILSVGPVSDTIDITGSVAVADVTLTQVGSTVFITEAAHCFCRGARLATPGGKVAVEDLAPGDVVVTARGPRPIRWIGTRAYEGRFIAGNVLALPVCLKRGALAPNVPSRDLWLSPGHGVRVDDVLVPAWRLVNGVTITQAETVERVEYFHIELDAHGLLFAEGTAVESYLDIGTRGQFHNAASAPAAPCGVTPVLPRLEDGFALAEIQARLARRAGLVQADAMPGPLRGFIDTAGDRLTGWAQDSAAPEAPVELEVLCQGRVVAHVLANGFRADLRAAGLGSGCHAFEVTLPPHQGAVVVRRRADGARLAQATAKAA